jgi:glycosyltransferase involved in cell wall biosynthesis
MRPLVSIGLPVYNGEASVEAAIRSALLQSYDSLELLISDNASIDCTDVICRKFERTDQRVRYIRQPKNLGAAQNFQWVFDHSNGVFFMWLGADDVLSLSYLEDNIKILEGNSSAVSSMTFMHCHSGATASIRPEHKTLNDIAAGDRIRAYLRFPGTNDRFYSLHRRWALEKCLPLPCIVANDWLLVVRLLNLGQMISHPSGSFYRKSLGGSSSSYESLMKCYGKTGLSTLFPLTAFAIAIYNEIPFRFSTLCYVVKQVLQISLLGQSSLGCLLRRSFSIVKSIKKCD